jgi:deazaflavin-dependent oxidoreductase (nitroreductase family)
MSPRLLKFISITHEFIYRASGGRLGANLLGRGMLLLITKGRKTGRDRTVPLQYMPDGDDFVVIASSAGNPSHPAWYLNLKAQPAVEVQAGRTRLHMHAETATGEDRERLWAAAVDFYPGYAKYQKEVERTVPVVVLRRQTPAT